MIVHGDCLDVLPTLEADSLDACVTDPPYGLEFMGKDWDHGVPGERFWREVLRVLKPGAHLLAFGGTRTYHRLACAIEDAGFEVRDCLMWLYGSGFPKSLDVSKALDKMVGGEREVVGVQSGSGYTRANVEQGAQGRSTWEWVKTSDDPATDLARQWSGWGTALKPAYEPILLARKPLVGTVAQNVARYGTGAINIDGCRVEHIGNEDMEAVQRQSEAGDTSQWRQRKSKIGKSVSMYKPQGRWPANVIHDGSDEVVAAFPQARSSGGGGHRMNGESVFGMGADGGRSEQYYDSGSAARFFYCAKASRSEREQGLDDLDETRRTDGRKKDIENPRLRTSALKNHHPTVKPLALMRYLVRLVTPPGGTVLDPFAGSGSTLVAAIEEGFDAIGIEREAEYVALVKKRLRERQRGLRWDASA